jgi:hypothetical protein
VSRSRELSTVGKANNLWRGIHGRYLSLSPATQTIVHNIVIWVIAGLAIWWVARGIDFNQFVKAVKQSNIPAFIAANVISFFVWWLGDTILFSVLFSYFHRKTSFRELLPATAAQYFLQAINILAADGALIVFLNRRKGVPWLTATWTMMFAGLIDALTLDGVVLAAAIAAPRSTIGVALPYAAGTFVFFILVAIWWARGRSVTRIGNWLRNRPSAQAFRAAGLKHYIVLCSIRLTLVIIQAGLYYWTVMAFVPDMPWKPVLTLAPAMMAVSNEPITPQGLGPLQAVFVDGLSRYAPAYKIFAASLAVSVIGLLTRLILGLGAAGTFARRVIAIEVAESRGEDPDAVLEAKGGS